MSLIFRSLEIICSHASSALLESLEPVQLNMTPPTNKPTPNVAAPKIVVPKAIPPPPAASEPPPRAARVALVAAAPLKAEIAVPVEAVPRAMTAAVVAPDAANPPAVPKAAPLKPPTRTLAPTDAFLISSPSNFGIDTFPIFTSANSGRFLIRSNKSENC